MLSEELRTRIGRLQREREFSPVRPAVTPPVARPVPAEGSNQAWTLAAAMTGEEFENGAGRFYRVRRPLFRVWPDGERLFREARIALRRQASVTTETRPELALFRRDFPEGVLFFDLETCGLAGSAVFLIGAVTAQDDALWVDQLLARDYSEEAAIVAEFARLAQGQELLASFNGKSFDLPMLLDRARRHRLTAPLELKRLPHLDLLHHARRLWRGKLPNCKLQTLERCILKRWRQGDLPSDRIPAAYHEFVRSGDAREIREIVTHNALDLLTLVQIAMTVGVTSADVSASNK